MKINNPEMKVIRFAADDVIATSIYIMKKSDYYNSNDEGFVAFTGVMGYYDDGNKGWNVADLDNGEASTLTGEMLEYFNEYYSHMTFDAYRGEDGYIYTKGASYYDLYNNQ